MKRRKVDEVGRTVAAVLSCLVLLMPEASLARTKKKGPQDATAIWMRHLGRRTGQSGEGEILFYLQRGGEPFFTLTWWVS